MTHKTWHTSQNTWDMHMTKTISWQMIHTTWHTINNMRHTLNDTWSMTNDKWHMTHDTWHMTHDIYTFAGTAREAFSSRGTFWASSIIHVTTSCWMFGLIFPNINLPFSRWPSLLWRGQTWPSRQRRHTRLSRLRCSPAVSCRYGPWYSDPAC